MFTLPQLRRLLALASTALLAVLACASPAEAATCDRFAGPFGSDQAAGTEMQPYGTAQRLADALTAGQTGCLLAGTYDDEIAGPYVMRVSHGGAPGAPLTIRSAPGQRATLRGVIYVPPGSNNVTLSNLDFDARRPTPDTSAGIQIMANDTIVEDSFITNHRTANCMILGIPGFGQAARTIVRRNVFRECGGTETIREHAIYVEYTDSVLITDNLFDSTGAYAVHLYPEAARTTVTHNVMVNGGGGVIFAGEAGGWASRDSVVEKNIITGSWRRAGIHSWWGGPIGTGNIARDNCLINNLDVEVDISGGGFTSTRNVIANPQYRNPATRDYRLAPTSPCLSVVGYDTVAKIMGDPVAPAPTPTPTATATAAAPTPTPTATATATPAQTPTPTTPASTPAPTQTPAPSPAATATPTSTPAAPATPTTPEAPVPVVPEVEAPPSVTSPENAPEPGVEPIEAAVFIDDDAFSFSGGSNKPQCPRRNGVRRCR